MLEVRPPDLYLSAGANQIHYTSAELVNNKNGIASRRNEPVTLFAIIGLRAKWLGRAEPRKHTPTHGWSDGDDIIRDLNTCA